MRAETGSDLHIVVRTDNYQIPRTKRDVVAAGAGGEVQGLDPLLVSRGGAHTDQAMTPHGGVDIVLVNCKPLRNGNSGKDHFRVRYIGERDHT